MPAIAGDGENDPPRRGLPDDREQFARSTRRIKNAITPNTYTPTSAALSGKRGTWWVPEALR